MPPNNQQMPSQPSDPFGFITNSAPVGKKPSPLTPTTMNGRIILLGSILLLVVIIAIVFMSFLNNSSEAKAKQYLEIGQKQTEIIRLSAIAETKGRSLETRSYASTIKLSFTSSQSAVNKVITANGISSKQLSKELTKSKNTKSDAILDEAEKNNRFDETFKELIESEMQKYQQQLNSIATSSTKNEKTILEDAFNQASLLQGPSKS
jgi:hypothetical protein